VDIRNFELRNVGFGWDENAPGDGLRHLCYDAGTVANGHSRRNTHTRTPRSIPHSGHSSSFFRVHPESLVFS
jgi:hypothetical protein